MRLDHVKTTVSESPSNVFCAVVLGAEVVELVYAP